MLLSAHIVYFLEYLMFERSNSPQTIKNYQHYLTRFLEFVQDLEPQKIDLELIRRYKLYLSHYLDPKHGKPLKKVTQNYFYIALRTFLRYLAQKNISVISADEISLIKIEPRSMNVLDESSLKLLLDAPDTSKISGIRDKAILETLLSTGLRVSELASLNCDTVDLTFAEFKIIGKGGKERVVTISESAADWLEKYLMARKDTFKPLFIRFQGKLDSTNDGENMRLTPRSIERIVEKYVKAINLPIKATPQTFRNYTQITQARNGQLI